jgi:hypothetical protein
MATLKARVERYRNWVEPLGGRVCSRVTIDRYEPPVVIWFLYDGPAARVEINVPFRLQLGPEAWDLDPWTKRLALAPVLSLIERRVTSAVAGRDGGLRVEFSGDAAVDVPRTEGVVEPWWYDVAPEDDPGSDIPSR